MLSVAGIWIYMFLTTFLAGYGVMRLLTRYLPYRVRHMDTYLLCGLAAVTVYAQFYSLFGRVGPGANLLLILFCLTVLWRGRRELGAILRRMRHTIGGTWSGRLTVLLFLLFAYGASRGIIHYDTGLYHAQSIRWLEEYGVVKGLGNLHCRLAYNSSSFALSALYSMAFLGGQSYHCAAGWLAFLLARICLEMTEALRNGRLRTGDFARVMCVYYLVNIFDEMISPASDYFMVLLAFYLIIRWLDLLDAGGKETFPFALLCVMGVFLMTVKLSAALILLLAVYPAYGLLKGRGWKETGIYLGLGFVTALPFLVRNVLLSGWLVYPFTQIDLFDVAWKIPKGAADYDAKEIQVWGRGYSDVARYDISMKEWLPEWFRSLAGSDKIFVLAALAAAAVLLGYAAGMAAGLWQRRWDVLLVQVTVTASFLFWIGTSPLIRYGCVYVYLTPAVVFGGIYDALMDKEKGKAERTGRRVLRRCGVAAAVLVTGYKCLALGGEIAASYENDYWLTQKEYENYETISYQINGVTFYYPVNGDQVGYEDFPSAPARAQIAFMGEDIRDGFTAAPE